MSRNRCNQVITFEPCSIDDRNSKRDKQFFDDVELLIQNVRLLLSLSLVLGNRFVPEGLLSPIEHHNDTVWFMVFHQRVQHGAKAVHRVGYLPTRSGHVGR